MSDAKWTQRPKEKRKVKEWNGLGLGSWDLSFICDFCWFNAEQKERKKERYIKVF